MGKIPHGELLQVAKTSSGLVLCRKLLRYFSYQWRVGNKYLRVSNVCQAWNPQAIRQNLQSAIRMAGHELRKNVPRKLSKDEIEYFIAYNGKPQAKLEYRKRNGWFNSTRAVYNEDICWELPSEGSGFTTYNRDDLKLRKWKLKDGFGYDQIGTKQTIDALMLVSKTWISISTNPKKRLLQIGDISRPGGINTPDHGGHQTGKIVDIRPLRNDSKTGIGANLDYASSSYDQALTIEFIRHVKKLYPSIHIKFNDGKIASSSEFTYVKKDRKGTVHDNHLHLEFPQ